MAEEKPTIGRIVHYALSAQDADAINRRRKDAARNLAAHRDAADGSQIHTGNAVAEGDVYPLFITRVWGDQPNSSVNGQVMLDGADVLWVTSVSVGEGPRHFTWPERV